MKELEVLLALVICMVIFSTIVSMIIEAIARTFRLRGGLLKSMLRSIYENEIEQKILKDKELVPLGLANKIPLDAPLVVLRKIFGLQKPTVLSQQFALALTSSIGASSSMETVEFLRKLGDSEIGEKIHLKYRKNTDIIINDLANKFEEFGKEASSIYRKYTGLLNTIVAIIFAFALNINVVSLAKEFYNNAALSNQMIVNMERYQADAQRQIDSISKLTNTSAENQISLEQLTALKADIENVKALGLPIGYKNQTYLNIKSTWGQSANNEVKSNSTSTSVNETKKTSIFFSLFWGFSTLFTGILIGLGAPFWFDIVKRIGSVQKVTSSLMGATVVGATPETKIVMPVDESTQRKQEIDAFNKALEARNVAQRGEKIESAEGFRAVDRIIV